MANTDKPDSSGKRGEQGFLFLTWVPFGRKLLVLCFGIGFVGLSALVAGLTASAHAPVFAVFQQVGSAVPTSITPPINANETDAPPTFIPATEQKDTPTPCPECTPTATVGNYKVYGIPIVRVHLLTPPIDEPNFWEKFRDFVVSLWPQVKDVLTVSCLGATVIYVVIFLMLTYWGFRERLFTLAAEAKTRRAPVTHLSEFAYEILLFIFGPLLYLLDIGARFILFPIIYSLGYASAAILGLVWTLVSGFFKKLKELIDIGARGWVRRGKALYQTTRHLDKNLERWHNQFTHSVDLRVQLLTSWKNVSQYFIKSGFLKTSTKLGRTSDAVMTLSTIIQDETHPIPRRKEAIDGLLELCPDSKPGKTEEIENFLLLIAQDTALDAAIRVRAACALTKYARRSIPRDNPAYFSEDVAYQAWKDIASDHQIRPITVRVGAINMIRKRLGHVFRAQRELYELLISNLDDRKNAKTEFCIRVAHALLSMMCENGNHTRHKADIPLNILRHMSLCEECPPELQYLAVFGLGKFARQPDEIKTRLLRPPKKNGDRDENEKDQTPIPYIEETGRLLQRLGKTGKRNTRLKAVAALRHFECASILEKLANTAEWKRNDDLAVRKCAARNLAKLDARKAATAWRTIAEDKDIDILDRLEAAEQALMNGEQYGHQFLLQTGANHSGEHRLLAAQALIRCNYIEEGRSILILLSRDMTRDRGLAGQAFDELKKLPI